MEEPRVATLGDAMADYNRAGARVQALCRTGMGAPRYTTGKDNFALDVGAAVADFLRAGGDLSVTGIEELTKVASQLLSAQKEVAVRADKDREATTSATVAMANATKQLATSTERYVKLTFGVLVVALLGVIAQGVGVYVQAKAPVVTMPPAQPPPVK